MSKNCSKSSCFLSPATSAITSLISSFVTTPSLSISLTSSHAMKAEIETFFSLPLSSSNNSLAISFRSSSLTSSSSSSSSSSTASSSSPSLCKYKLPSSAVLSSLFAMRKNCSKSICFLSSITLVIISSSCSGVTTPSSSISQTPADFRRAVTETLPDGPFNNSKPSMAIPRRISKLGISASSSTIATSSISSVSSSSVSSIILIFWGVGAADSFTAGFTTTGTGLLTTSSSSSSSLSSNSSRSVVIPSMASCSMSTTSTNCSKVIVTALPFGFPVTS